jgi:hypothetical protein
MKIEDASVFEVIYLSRMSLNYVAIRNNTQSVSEDPNNHK